MVRHILFSKGTLNWEEEEGLGLTVSPQGAVPLRQPVLCLGHVLRSPCHHPTLLACFLDLRGGGISLRSRHLGSGSSPGGSDAWVFPFPLGYGSVYFQGNIVLADMNLDDIVHIRRKEVIVYPDDEHKPPIGEGLNRYPRPYLILWPSSPWRQGKLSGMLALLLTKRVPLA